MICMYAAVTTRKNRCGSYLVHFFAVLLKFARTSKGGDTLTHTIRNIAQKQQICIVIGAWQ